MRKYRKSFKTEELGLDHEGKKGRQRTINSDGTYNIKRILPDDYPTIELFHWLINTNWKKYWLAVFLFYGFTNFVFAVFYFLLGSGSIQGVSAENYFLNFVQCFFFSSQTFTTVGYGGMHPIGFLANFISSLEAFFGLMSFALATGTLYGRFSKPQTNLKFSSKIIVAPFQDFTALQFMVANLSKNTLMEMEAVVSFSWLEKNEKDEVRKFKQLDLEYSKIQMFPTSWKINHVIDEQSPLWEKSEKDLNEMELEVFIMLKGFNETASQIVYSRYSYTNHELVFGAVFEKPFYTDEFGKVVMDFTKLGNYKLTPIS